MKTTSGLRPAAPGALLSRPLPPLLALGLMAAVAACTPGAGNLAGALGGSVKGPDPNTKAAVAVGFSEASHSKAGEANDAVVFPQSSVNEFRVEVSNEDWEAMLANMAKLYGARGQAGGMGGGGQMMRPDMGASGAFPGGMRPARPEGGASGAFPGGMMPPGGGLAAGDPRATGAAGPGGGFGGGPLGTGENPMWVQGTVHYQGKVWPHVGIRFKGNSSLNSAWRSGGNRLPLKLDFDQWEKEYPAILDQRFWGHKQLALSTNFSDPTAMRESISYGLLADAGLPAAHTGFYELVLNHGGETENLGVYTAVEVIDDTAVKRVFGKDKGNIYEGDGQAVSLALGTRDRIPESFPKENNEDSDWSDLQKLYDVLHSAERKSNPAAWRAQLDATFNTDTFLEWLAIAAALQHWDTYGGMAHNFYLYQHHDTQKLEWISWDHNLVLSASVGGGGMAPAGALPFPLPSGVVLPPDGAFPVPPGGAFPPDLAASGGALPGGMGRGGPGRGASLDRKDTGDNWPLIRFLMDDPVYQASYVKHMRAISQKGFTPGELNAKVDALAAVLGPAMAKSGSGSAFTSGVATLKQAIATQSTAIGAYLATQP